MKHDYTIIKNIIFILENNSSKRNIKCIVVIASILTRRISYNQLHTISLLKVITYSLFSSIILKNNKCLIYNQIFILNDIKQFL